MNSLISAVVTLVAGLMALTLVDANTVRRKSVGDRGSRNPSVQESMRALFYYINILGNPNLQYVPFSGLNAADAVIANVACVLFALYFAKPAGSTVDAWLVGSDNATTAGANGDLVMKVMGVGASANSLGGRQYAPWWGDGLPFGTGLTLGSHTTNNGSTKSALADAPTGFAIIGAGL